MKENLRILCIDFDDVIFKTRAFVEEIIEKVEYKGSGKYFRSIELDDKIDEETKRILRLEHFEHKDRILEEVDEKYKGLIDYEKIFATNSIYPGSIEYVNYLCQCGRYDKVYILTHCNVLREIKAKLSFIKKNFPLIEVITVPFHREKFKEGVKRKTTSKAEYLMEYLNLDNIFNCTLIDDSMTNGRDWLLHGGKFIRYNPNNKNSWKKKELSTLFPFDIFMISDNDKLQLPEGRSR